ncbi:MAG: hypothetical protein WBG10_17550 [Pseudolabrys sp.]
MAEISICAYEGAAKAAPQPVVTPFPWEHPAVGPIPDEPGAPAQGEADIVRPILEDDPKTIIEDVRGHVVVVVSREKTDNLVEHLFTSLGDKNSPQAKTLIGKLSTRIQGFERDNQKLTVKDFLTFVKEYANEAFDPATAGRIVHTMEQLSTNDPNVVSSERLRDDNELNRSYLLTILR